MNQERFRLVFRSRRLLRSGRLKVKGVGIEKQPGHGDGMGCVVVWRFPGSPKVKC